MGLPKTIKRQFTKGSFSLACLKTGHRLIIIVLLLIMNHVNIISQTNDSIPQSDLEHPLMYNAEDSIVMDMANQKARLYSGAHIEYGEIVLDACFIEFDFETKEVFAKLCLDSLGEKIEVPLLKNEEQETTADSLKFNFESKRGITYKVKMQEGEGYIQASKVKRQNSGDIHIDTALYTTCDLDHPHYYFKLRKAIIKPNDKIISGPVNLFIADIPTPLGLPFGYFPNKTRGANGLIIPSYGNSPTLGYFLSEGGYYHKFKNDKLAMRFLGNIYSKGSWGLKTISTYKSRYKHNGNLMLSFNQIRQGDKDLETLSVRNEFKINWTHTQDPKARPGSTFRATINAGSQGYHANDFTVVNTNQYLTNNFNSSIAWSKRLNMLKGKLPSNLNVNLRHSQNTNTNNVSFTVPEVTFNINRFYPTKLIKSGNAVRSSFRKNVLDKIGVNYNTTMKNEALVADSTLSINNLENVFNSMEHGMRHTFNINTSWRGKKIPITFTPSYQGNFLLYLDNTLQNWDNSDSSVNTLKEYDLYTPFWSSLSMSMTTKVYGFYEPASFLQGERETKFRHTITPNISFTYRPDKDYTNTYTVDSGATPYDVSYSPYQYNIYGIPPSGSSNRLGFNLINSIEMRQNNLNDTTGDKPYIKTKIIENITFSSGYDFQRDSLQLDDIVMNGRTTLYKNINLRFGGRLNPYSFSSEGTQQNILQQQIDGRLGTLENVNLAIGFFFSAKGNKKKEYNSDKGTQNELDQINNNPDAYMDFSNPWSVNVNYKIDRNRIISSSQDTVNLIQTINFTGDFNITPKWKVDFTTNYDFTRKEFSYTSVGINRDLHCWQMQFNWIPFGYMKSYNIQINVKSSLLQDLKLQRRRTWYDSGVR